MGANNRGPEYQFNSKRRSFRKPSEKKTGSRSILPPQAYDLPPILKIAGGIGTAIGALLITVHTVHLPAEPEARVNALHDDQAQLVGSLTLKDKVFFRAFEQDKNESGLLLNDIAKAQASSIDTEHVMGVAQQYDADSSELDHLGRVNQDEKNLGVFIIDSSIVMFPLAFVIRRDGERHGDDTITPLRTG